MKFSQSSYTATSWQSDHDQSYEITIHRKKSPKLIFYRILSFTLDPNNKVIKLIDANGIKSLYNYMYIDIVEIAKEGKT